MWPVWAVEATTDIMTKIVITIKSSTNVNHLFCIFIVKMDENIN